MAFHHSPKIPNSGLLLALDGASVKSNPRTGTTWRDLSGNGNHFTVPSNSNTGTDVNLSNTIASRGALSGTYNTSESTFDTWFYIGNNGTYTGCCDTLFGTYWFRTFIISQSLYTMIGFMNSSGSYLYYQHPAYSVAYGQWHHTLGMRRGNRYIIWLNGVEVYNTSYGSGEFLWGFGGGTGGWDIGYNRHPNFKVGAARVWNRGLSDTEIVEMYNSQRNRFSS